VNNVRHALVLVVYAVAVAQPQSYDLILSADHTPADYSIGAMAGSGIAIERGIASCLLNPALPNAYSRDHELKFMTLAGGYGRDNVFTSRTVPLGFSLTIPHTGTIGVLGRDMSAGENQNQYEATLSLSGRMFENNQNQGPVDIGVNVRYERAHWVTDGFDTLRSAVYDVNGAQFVRDSALTPGPSYIRSGDLQQDRLMVDVGFYQSRIADYVEDRKSVV
jgi:hypothetical protein